MMPRSGYLLMVALALLVSVCATAWLLRFGGRELIAATLPELARQLIDGQLVNDGWHSRTLPVYALICVVSQLIVVPSGSLILLVAGFLYGPVIAATVFSLAQILTAWPVYRVASEILHKSGQQSLAKFHHILPGSAALTSLREESFVASVTIRLTPVIPSAVAVVLAAALQIPVRVFLLATVAVCWVRPLFFAAVGGSFGEVSQLRESLDSPGEINVAPLVIVFVTAALLLLARLWLRYRRQSDH